ncbi:MAG: hypothetical protein EAZ12_01650 [Sphingobacteriia bacterium]|nr:MAG: hypothetical protein EAZ12_01650 [Sphingobacteriia bacterium]
MEVKSTKRIIVIRMLDWAIVALVVLLALIVLVGLTTNKPISFWGLQFNLNNNYAATERSNLVDNSSPIVLPKTTNSTLPTNTNTEGSSKVIANNSSQDSKPASNTKSNKINPYTNPIGASSIKVEKPPIDPSSRTIRKSTYAASSPYNNDSNSQLNQDQSTETDYSNSTNGNPYINNGANRTPKESPRSNSGGSMAGARNFSQSEMNEFMRQFPNKKTDIHFVHFGYLDAEMEAVRAQILAALNKYGYTNIDANWNKYTDYTTINEVHFGVNGYSGANFYIPKAKN